MEDNEIKVWKEDFAIMKSRRFYENAFCNIQDDKELTVIIDQTKVDEKDAIEIDKYWKLITIDIVFEFEVVGVMAKLSTALAKVGISILPIAAYSRDHILVKKEKINQAVDVLKGVEFK